MASIRDDMNDSTVVAAVIGVVAGALTGFATVVANARPGEGFLGFITINALGLTVLITVTTVSGAVVGLCVGAIEGVVAFALAQWSARSFKSLWTFATTLGLALVAVNATIAAVAVNLAYGSDGSQVSDFVAPIVSAMSTAIAVAVFAVVQASDWPMSRERSYLHANRIERSETVVDLTSTRTTMRHDGLVADVRARIEAEDIRRRASGHNADDDSDSEVQ